MAMVMAMVIDSGDGKENGKRRHRESKIRKDDCSTAGLQSWAVKRKHTENKKENGLQLLLEAHKREGGNGPQLPNL